MNLSCAILHTDAQTARILEEYAGKTPFLTLCGTYTHTTDALKDYYERKVDVYFIGLGKSTELPGRRYQVPHLLPGNPQSITLVLPAKDRASAKYPKANEHKEKNGSSDIIYIKAESRLIRLKLDHIYYIEAWGDYVKIFCSDEGKPILSLCSLKYMEEKLPSALFIRIHRSYIVRKACIRTIMQNSMHVVGRELPIGEVYRKRVKELVSHLLTL